ncbi:unnamed protein product [Blepharisma stoltei]|uniref:Lysosomal dipeptide transporter MFSD1 n=1 Tax=Blepharisma stoltei TaxID=1481888 RepID=A0AAU9KCK9_9CILI|nr:unnamed protein product [Blepharisma stoltei]
MERRPLLEIEDEDPCSRKEKIKFFIFVVLLLACSSFIYDLPSALQVEIMEECKMSALTYIYFYVYTYYGIAFSNMFGGIITDVFGLRKSIIMFTTGIIFGQYIVAIGLHNQIIWVCIIGRLIIGMFYQVQYQAVLTLVLLWFKERRKWLVFFMNFGMGNSLSYIILPIISNSVGLVPSLSIALIICSAGLIFGCKLFKYDMKRDDMLCDYSIKSMSPVYRVRKELFRMNNREYSTFKVAFYLIYATVFMFINISNGYFQYTFEISNIESGSIICTFHIIIAILVPFFDKWNSSGSNRKLVLLFSIIIISLSILIFALASWLKMLYLAVIDIFILGVGYSLYVSFMWNAALHVRVIRKINGYLLINQNVLTGLSFLIIIWVENTDKQKEFYDVVISIFFCLSLPLLILTALSFKFIKNYQGLLDIDEPSNTEYSNLLLNDRFVKGPEMISRFYFDNIIKESCCTPELKWKINDEILSNFKIENNAKSAMLKTNINVITLISEQALPLNSTSYIEIFHTNLASLNYEVEIGIIEEKPLGSMRFLFSDEENSWGIFINHKMNARSFNFPQLQYSGKGGIVGLLVDTAKGKIKFLINGKYFGVAINDIEISRKALHVAVSMCHSQTKCEFFVTRLGYLIRRRGILYVRLKSRNSWINKIPDGMFREIVSYL